jgi:hypothetical protein
MVIDSAHEIRSLSKLSSYWEQALTSFDGQWWGEFVFDQLSHTPQASRFVQITGFEAAIFAFEKAETDFKLDIGRYAGKEDVEGLDVVRGRVRLMIDVLQDILNSFKDGIPRLISAYESGSFLFQTVY